MQNILKGGEDSIGAAEAIQRVYFNIGSCAEQCWLNHLPDLRAIDPAQRNYGQTPLDIGQCRRDCASFRAIEDRLDDVVAFFLTARPADLCQARGFPSPQALDAQLDQEFGAGSVALGRAGVRDAPAPAAIRARSGPYDNVDFRATDPSDPTLRLDFLSNERPVLASRIGTYPGRAMHSNHMASRVWDQYAALRPAASARPIPALLEVMKGGGRGYYRPPSLLSVWAYAPFMHNNAIGPEVCGKPVEPGRSTSTRRPMSTRTTSRSPTRRLRGRSTRASRAATSCSRSRWTSCSIRTGAAARCNLVDEDIIVDIASKVKLGRPRDRVQPSSCRRARPRS